MNNKKTRVVTAGVLVHALGAFRRLMKSIVDALHLKSEISNFKFKFFAWVRASSAHLAQNSLYMRARVWAWALAFSMAALAAAPAGAQLGSTGTSSGLTLDDRAGGYWDWLIYPNAGILRISTNNAVSDLLTILNNGNVGIGTNNPTLAKLHIAGDMRATGNVMGAYLVLDNVGAPGSGGLIGRSGTGETLYWHDGTAARTVLHTGNLGSIAILNQNDLQAGSTFYVSSASVGGQTLLARTSGNVGIGVSGTPAEKLEVNGYVRVPAASGGLKMDALSVLYQSGGTLLINNSASQAIQITQAGSPKLAIDTNGNVGIGTAAPDTNVHVYESNTDTLPALKVEQASTGDSAVLISGDSRSWAIGIDASAGDGILKISSGTTLDNAVLGTRDVLTILGSGNAGIGTASPAFKFHVYDSNPTLLVEATASSSTIRMYKSGNSMGIINYDHFNLANLYIDNYYPGDATYGGIRFRRNTGTFGSPVLTEIMTLEGTGNVGIGTASPAQMLHVQGDINVATGQGFRINNTATSGQYLRGNGTRFVSSAIQASDLGTAAILNQSAIQSGAVFHVSSGSVDGQALLAAVSGRVGIGTNSPSGWGKLSVIESTTDSTLFLQNSNMSNDPRIAMDPTSGSPWVLGINNDDGDKFMIGNAGDLTLNSSIRMTIDTNGNVGIGTVTPIVTLHVEGGNLVVASGVTQTTITSAGNIQMPGSIIMDGNNGDVLDLDELEFQNAGADPNAYRLRRNATDLKWHDGTAARTLIHTGNIGTYETDPQVGAITTSYVPRWDGSALVTGTIYDNATSIGIGTGVPQEKLHIHDAGVNSKTKFTNSTTGAGATDGSAVGAVNLDTYLMNYEAGKLQLGTSNAWRMTILSGGNVGIGTENPVGRLDVYDANGYYQQGFRVLASSDTKAFVGVQAGTSTATGTYLTFMGYRAGTSNTTGLSNTFIGGLSGYNHKNGQGNTYLGVEAGYGDVSGNHNTFVGFESGYINTASRNTFVGAYSGDSNTAGQENVFLGYQAGQTNSSASQGTFVGYMAGSTNNGADNTFVGHLSGATNGSGTQNVFLGRRAGYSNSTGGSNVFVGYSAGDANTATGNVMVGWAAGDQNNSGNENVFVGYSAAGANTTGNGNTIVGYLAGNSQQTADGNTFVGRGAGLNTTTGQNTFLGYQSGVLNTGGGSNTFIGYEAGRNNTTGNYNTTLGRDAGYSLTMGTGNVLIGYQAGYNLTTSSNTLYIANKNYGSPLIYGDFHTGKVGIGTASPAARLQVDHVGSATAIAINNGSASTGQNQIDFNYSGTTQARIRKSQGGGLFIGTEDATQIDFVTAGAAGKMTILSGGNVGIGTQNPAEKLDVEGAIQMGTTSDSCSSTTRGTMRYVAGGTGVADVYQQCVKNSTDTYSWQGTGGETGEKGVYEFYYRDNNLDNIPDTAFDDFLNSFQLGTTSYVLMKVVVSADTTLGSWCSERGDWYRDQYIANTPGAGSTPTSGTWRKWYRNNAFGDWIESSVGYTNYFGSSCDGSSTYGWCSEWGIGGNNLAIFPNQTGGNELYSNGWNAGDGYVLIRFGSDPYLVCGLDPHTRVYENGANVGIGTTSPADVLEVYTGASASNFRFSTDALTLADANSASKLPYIEWRESIGGIRAMYMGWGTTTSPKRIDMVLENAYELDITGGNVGIGTTDPQEKFHVAGGAAYFDSPAGAIRVLGTAGTPGANDLGIWERLNPDTYAIADWNTGTNGIFINTPSGNVGIGTTNTASPLFIRKLPRVQSPSRALITLYDNSALAAGIGGGIEMGYDGGANVYSGASISAYKENATSGDYSTALIFTTRVNGGSVTEQMRIESGGFVGIGTTNASYPLHVYTATTEAGASWLDNNDNSGTGVGVYAYADGAGGTTHYGIYAVGSGATTNYGLYNAIGTKSWANPHPKDPTKSIVYATLEGGENATYWRGRAEVLNGKGTVKLPEHFILASSPDYDVTVQVTPRSADSRGLAVTKSSIEGFEVAELMGGRGTYEFDFIVLGKRRAYEEWNPIQEVLDYVPYHGNQPHEEGVYDETTQEWYDKHSNGLKRIFISNGLLNSDGTVNEGTFARHGWKIAREEDKKSHEKRQKEEEKNMVGPAAPEAPLQSAGLSKGLLRDDLMAKK